jgi:Fur family ferric uptake transcriptional regulator
VIRRLRLAGHQVTAARAAVVETIAALGRPFTAGELCAAVGARAPSVGRATIFRTLELLEEEGLVARLFRRSGPSYVLCDAAHPARSRHFLVCVACDGVAEFDDPRLATLLQSVAQRQAFRPEADFVEIFGRCRAC